MEAEEILIVFIIRRKINTSIMVVPASSEVSVRTICRYWYCSGSIGYGKQEERLSVEVLNVINKTKMS